MSGETFDSMESRQVPKVVHIHAEYFVKNERPCKLSKCMSK